MNEHFVNVKVDREERPDIDEIYMQALQSMSGAGGWPMSVFLTPELEPFFGGTYFPPHVGVHGRPAFMQVLMSLARAWERDREQVARRGRDMARRIAAEGGMDARSPLDADILELSLRALKERFDPIWGGFGDAPKFPHAMDLRLCLRHHLRTGRAEDLALATLSLQRMASGGIYDQLGGGFHRYSTDERWLIPHFEKMLYDNALLVPAYLEAYLVTGDEHLARVARECCEWTLREMSTPEGGFASTQDADTEGAEGRFFVWTPDELARALGARRGAWAQEWFGVDDAGNFEHGASALWRPETDEAVARKLGVDVDELRADMEQARAELRAVREQRVHPGRDDKILAAWNGLMIGALAQAYQVLGDERYLDAARRAARYVLDGMRQPDGRLFATARHGTARHNGCLDDYAFVIQGLIDLYESDFDPAWIRDAHTLEELLTERFWDAEHGGFFTTGSDHEALIARLKNPHDGALPAGNAVQALNLLRLAELTGRGPLAQRAEATLRSLGQLVNRFPAAFSQLLIAADFLHAAPLEVVIAGERDADATRSLLRAVRGAFRPQRVVALADSRADEDLMPFLQDRAPGAHGARAYVCRNYACQEPVDSAQRLADALA
jgi:hypothetical protein